MSERIEGLLTDEEVETYFGEVLRLLEETNTKK